MTAPLSFESLRSGAHDEFYRLIAPLFQRHRDGYLSLIPQQRFTISFVRSGPLSIQQVGLIALLARHLAEAGTHLSIKWPRPHRRTPSALQYYLRRLGLADILAGTGASSSWTERIVIDGTILKEGFRDDDPRTTHYVPLQWITIDDFVIPEGVTGDALFSIRPRLKASRHRAIAQLLAVQDFADGEIIDVLVRTVFLELAWNVVLHSMREPGKGLGVFGAQIVKVAGEPKTRLEMIVEDLGVGIPFTLGIAYGHSGLMYERDYGTTRANAVLRYAIEPGATSRTRFPELDDARGFRGLTRVVRETRPNGGLAFRSDIARLRVISDNETTRPEVPRDDNAYPIPGVQILFYVGSRSRTTAEHLEKAYVPATETLDIHRMVGLDGSLGHLGTEEAIVAAVQSITATGGVTFLDIGFGDTEIRQLEFIIRTVGRSLPGATIVFWNIRTSLNQLVLLQEWFAAQSEALASVVLVGGPDDLALATSRNAVIDRTLLDGAYGFRIVRHDALGSQPLVHMDLAAYIHTNGLVNRKYIGDGFESGDPRTGFFSGRIHLLSGAEVNRFFSLGVNVGHPDGGNLNRWINTCVTCIRYWVSTLGEEETVVVLALGAPMRELMGQVHSRLGGATRIYTLLTYDMPSTREVRAVLGQKTTVILAADVLRSGSLANGVAESVRGSGSSVVGMVTLVNAMEDRGSLRMAPNPSPADWHWAWHPPKQLELYEQKEYWVDPVSMVPTDKRLFGGELDKRFRPSIDFLGRSGAIRVGHLIDGSRHSSTYIDVHELLENHRGAVKDRLLDEVTERLGGAGWSTFSPRAVLFPAGVGRFEPAVGTRGRAVYETAVRRFVSILKEVWPDLEEVEVPRTFDPGGRSRCARVLPTASLLGNVADVIVADDGMWSGATVHSLVDRGLGAKAARILVVPLLARISNEEVRHLLKERSISTDGGTAAILYLLPYVLPIPYYSDHDCPFEATLSRLRRLRSNEQPLKDIVAHLESQLAPRAPTETYRTADWNAQLWLTLRSYVELATEDEDALTWLVELINAVHDDRDLTTLFTLFLFEWRVLGRSRVRQVVGPLIEKRALRTALDDAASSESRICAVSLLRSRFVRTFLTSCLPVLGPIAKDDPALLERTLLHIASLAPSELHRPEVRVFLHTVTEGDWAIAEQKDERGRAFDIAVGYYQLLLFAQGEPIVTDAAADPTACVAELLSVLDDDTRYQHGSARLLSMIQARKDQPPVLSPETYQQLSDAWRANVIERLLPRLIGALKNVRSLLLATDRARGPLLSPGASYLTDLRVEGTGILRDFSVLTVALDWLSKWPRSEGVLQTALDAAGRLHANALGMQSLLRVLCQRLQAGSVGWLMNACEEAIRLQLRLAGVDVQLATARVDDAIAGRRLLVPLELLQDAINSIASNLTTHAFGSEYGGGAPMVMIGPLHANEGLSQRRFAIGVWNNGVPLKEDVKPSRATLQVMRELAVFGGRLFPAIGSTLPGYEVLQRVEVGTW